MKVLTVVGARPQFIKSVLVSEKLKLGHHEEVLVHTGQHYDPEMSDIFFKELHIDRPAYNLGVRSNYQGEQTALMLDKLECIMLEETPDVVLVYGDTNSTLAAALAASKLMIPIAHVEAGCRSGDKTMPEEINRVFTDYVSTLHFCPTMTTQHNLFEEGIYGAYLTGDVMVEMIDRYRHVFECHPRLCDDEYILMTIHRPSNVNSRCRIDALFRALEELSTKVVFPIHPRTAKTISSYDVAIPPNVQVIDPLGYIEMLEAMNSSIGVLTDSGGVQKEAYILSVPCTTIRNTTEWPETLENDWNVLCEPEDVIRCVIRPRPKVHVVNLFGSGSASNNIVEALETWYGTDRTTN